MNDSTKDGHDTKSLNGPVVDAGSSETPSFLVGVAGDMDLTPAQRTELAVQLRTTYGFLLNGGRKRANASDETYATQLAELLAPESQDPEAYKTYHRALNSWAGLGTVPLCVMSNCAPGVDSLALQVAAEAEFVGRVSLRAPLPFPAALYRKSTSFVRRNATAEANKNRQTEFDQTLNLVGKDNAFPIWLADDCALSNAQRHATWEADLDITDHRRRRYYAAGEYLANYCHFLIVAQPPDAQGATVTSDLIEARLLGPQPRVLPNSQQNGKPHGGPVLYLPLADESDVSKAAILMHPYAEFVGAGATALTKGADQSGVNSGATPVGTPERQTALHVQSERIDLFSRTAHHLREFVVAAHPQNAELQDKRFEEMLTTSDTPKQNLSANIKKLRLHGETTAPGEEGAFSQQLRPVTELRAKARDLNRTLKERHDRNLRNLFLITFLAATMFHLFAHWHPQNVGHGAAASSDSGQEVAHTADVPQLDVHHVAVHHVDIVRTAMGAAAGGLAILGLIVFALSDGRQNAEKAHDYRALAEGLRVQLYWNLAGLGRSVSANYAQRQRGELDWIRAAIRSVSFPYERWQSQFSQLAVADQITALQTVVQCWVHSQRSYFERSWHTHRTRRHGFQELGTLLAATGATLAIFAVVTVWNPEAFTQLMAEWYLLLMIAAGVWLLMFCIGWRTAGGHHSSANRSFWWITLLGWLLPSPLPHAPNPSSILRRITGRVLGFVAMLPVALVLAGLILAGCDLLAHNHALPDLLNWLIIISGMLLVGGGLLVAWPEKTLLSELAYQYNTMYLLFCDAAIRLEADIAKLEQMQGDEQAYQALLGAVQEQLYHLGKEALDENAEWLLLHRARPLEPVLAG